MLCRVLTALLVSLSLFRIAYGEDPSAVPLFDGKTFRGWEGDTQHTFRIQEGAIVGGSLQHPIPRNEFLCTEQEFQDFELRLQFRLVGEKANAGIQIRSRRIPNHHEVIGYQADLGDPGWWGSLYDESRRRKVLAQADAAAVAQVLRRNDWNDYLIRARGNRIQLWINDYPTIDYTEADPSIEQNGVICLQIHSGPPSEAWYKEITIRSFPK